MNPGAPNAYEGKISRAAHWCMRLAEGELSDLERMQFDLWLQSDADHSRFLANAVEAWRAAGRQACEPDMIALRSGALTDVQSEKEWRRRRARIGIAVLATAGALVVAAGLNGAPMLHPTNTYVTNVGERRVVVLADGSKLSLDALTRVKVRYTAGQRQFWLEEGRAKFDVAKNPLRPFTVAANGKLVVATGTQFSVELLPRQVRIDLYVGHVAILDDRADRGDIPAKAIRQAQPDAEYLAPGQELIASTQGATGVIRELGQADAPLWEGGQLVFDDERLSTVVERANRYSDKKIVLANDETGEQRISGVFTAGDTAALLMAITTVLPVRAVESDGAISLVLSRSRNISPVSGVRS